jgi:uncharacterized protein YukE
MTYSGFNAVPADFAAAAPRFTEAADELARARERAIDSLEGYGSFWANDFEFEHRYRGDWSAAADLATTCERALRTMGEELARVAQRYEGTDEGCAQNIRAIEGLRSAG